MTFAYGEIRSLTNERPEIFVFHIRILFTHNRA
jgi:hypothetical protein